ncbi:MAG: hypothetical protein ACR2LJ_09705 [Acidimicrobiales bacterium]
MEVDPPPSVAAKIDAHFIAEPLPALVPWGASESERTEALRAAARPLATSATTVAKLAVAAAVAADPGLAKDGRDVDLPPWQKGRYGTAVGRAVHGVLQGSISPPGRD